MDKNPIKQFARWFTAAKNHRSIIDATAMCVSTVRGDGFPDGRMVLLKDFDDAGFVFYTNLNSAKGKALLQTPKASLTFHWAPLEKQVRILGKTERVSDAEADVYWQTRPRLSQLGAWASKQSEELPSRAVLLKDVAKFALRFGRGAIPRPRHWTGVRVIPAQIEFWQGRTSRLHDRILYSRAKGKWVTVRLYP